MRMYSISSVAVMVAIFSIISVSDSKGQEVSENFDDLNDDNWTRYDPLGGGSFEFPDGAYELSTTAPENADYGPGRVGSILTGVATTDFRVTVDLLDWDATLPQTFGIIARANDVGLGTSTGYLFSYSPGASAGRSQTALAIERLDDEAIAVGGERTFLEGDLSTEAGYRMVFTGVGNQLSGSIYTLSNLNSALSSVTYTDDTYQSGGFGLIVTDSNTFDLQGATATFDNFSVTAIPEPANAVLLAGILGAGVLLFLRDRRERTDKSDE